MLRVTFRRRGGVIEFELLMNHLPLRTSKKFAPRMASWISSIVFFLVVVVVGVVRTRGGKQGLRRWKSDIVSF